MKSHFLLKMLSIWSLLLFSFHNSTSAVKGPAASAYSANVLNKWMALQVRLMQSTPHKSNGPFVRCFSYSSLAAYYSVAPGIPRSSTFWLSSGGLTNLTSLPEAEAAEIFHWPSSLNAALAFISRAMFPAATMENKEAINSLETALGSSFAREAGAASLHRSAQYGKQVSQVIFSWAETDGFHQASTIFSPQTDKGKWVPTPPAYDKPFTPNYGSLRTLVAGSLENAQPPAPIPYSEDSTSTYYKQAKEVFTISQNLTPEQKKITLFWKELNPGVTMPGHWLNVLRQLIEKENLTLDKAAYAYALTGMALNDTWISSWKTCYEYNLARPVTYIRDVLGYKDWLSMLPTLPSPEYTAMFAAAAGAVCTALAEVFGDNYTFTDHTYDKTGLEPRTYHSFTAMAKEAGESRLYGGIHYRFSVEAGLQQGRSVAKNSLRLLLQNKGK